MRAPRVTRQPPAAPNCRDLRMSHRWPVTDTAAAAALTLCAVSGVPSCFGRWTLRFWCRCRLQCRVPQRILIPRGHVMKRKRNGPRPANSAALDRLRRRWRLRHRRCVSPPRAALALEPRAPFVQDPVPCAVPLQSSGQAFPELRRCRPRKSLARGVRCGESGSTTPAMLGGWGGGGGGGACQWWAGGCRIPRPGAQQLPF